jgi:hypothetical protein
MDNISDMPTVEDLRMIARAAFEEMRWERPASGRGYLNDMTFAQRELSILDRAEVYAEEHRRHELLLRGYTPPDESNTRNSLT